MRWLGKGFEVTDRGMAMGTVADNLSAVKERIAKAATRVGRDQEGITLVAVTKTMPVERIP